MGLDELFLAMPEVAKSCYQDQQKQMAVFKKVLGVDLATSFKKRKDFKSDLEYKEYMMNNTKPNMLVLCNKTSYRNGRVNEGTVGRVLSCDINGPSVKWSSGRSGMDSFLDLDLFTTPIKNG